MIHFYQNKDDAVEFVIPINNREKSSGYGVTNWLRCDYLSRTPLFQGLIGTTHEEKKELHLVVQANKVIGIAKMAVRRH